MAAALALVLAFGAGVFGWFIVGDSVILARYTDLDVSVAGRYRAFSAVICGTVVFLFCYLFQKGASNAPSPDNRNTKSTPAP